MNPILEAEQRIIGEGKEIAGVFFDDLYAPARVTFHCKDGTTHDVKLNASHEQFMDGWRAAARWFKMRRSE